jgi:uncharacterized protein YukE
VGQLLGADPDELRDLGARMDSSADHVDHVAAGIMALLSSSRWEGADGERFRSEWHGKLRGQLTAASAAMRDCGRALRENVVQQTDASEAAGGIDKLSLALCMTTVLADMAAMSDRVSKDVVAKLPKLVRGLAFDPHGVSKVAKTAFQGLGAGLNAVGTVLDFTAARQAEPGSSDAFNKWVDFGFDGVSTFGTLAGVAAAAELIPGAQPIATAVLVIDVAHLAFDEIAAVDPELPGQVVSTVADAGKKAVDAAESVISGGVHAALSWL